MDVTITKLVHACLLVETGDRRVLLDPGGFTWQDERFDISLFHAISAEESWVLVGEIDGVIVGFLWATLEPMLERAAGRRIGRIRLIYTEPEARGVGVGHEMLEAVLAEMRPLGIANFDAPAGPGQRATKNFFEAHGFAARSIIMHHEDSPDDDG